MGNLIRHLIAFLLYGDKQAAALVGYTENRSEWAQYKIVIVPCGHLGKQIVPPDMGQPRVRQEGDTYVIETDMVYNAFFFTSLAEELLTTERDQHGRLTAAHSVLGQHNRLQIPLLDEYGHLLLKLLQLPMPPQQFSAVFLTHDIDTVSYYRSLRGAVGGIMRGQWNRVKTSINNLYNDPAYTFPWLMKQDAKVQSTDFNVHQLYFAKDTHGDGFDYPQYKLDGVDFPFLAKSINRHGGHIGWHSSYYHFLPKKDCPLINYSLHRSHYLRCDVNWLEKIAHQGVVHDFSIGFPDQAGFRLQTTRPVPWINPYTMELTSLILHPLTIMDATLSREEYMHLDEDEAYFCCQRLVDKVRQNNGELVLLWHNTNINPDTYHRSLYPKLLALI